MFTLQSDNKNVLMDSAYPAKSVSLAVKGKIEIAFVSVQVICNDVEEDRRFKSFNL
jgi:predicted solute-binding protein